MKTMTCAQMGGMCDEHIMGATPDDMIANGMVHVEQAHPEMATTIKSMSKDDPMMISWQQKFMAAWDATPEDA